MSHLSCFAKTAPTVWVSHFVHLPTQLLAFMTGSSVSSLFANYADHAIAHAFWAATNRFEAFVSFVDEVGLDVILNRA